MLMCVGVQGTPVLFPPRGYTWKLKAALGMPLSLLRFIFGHGLPLHLNSAAQGGFLGSASRPPHPRHLVFTRVLKIQTQVFMPVRPSTLPTEQSPWSLCWFLILFYVYGCFVRIYMHAVPAEGTASPGT